MVCNQAWTRRFVVRSLFDNCRQIVRWIVDRLRWKVLWGGRGGKLLFRGRRARSLFVLKRGIKFEALHRVAPQIAVNREKERDGYIWIIRILKNKLIRTKPLSLFSDKANLIRNKDKRIFSYLLHRWSN